MKLVTNQAITWLLLLVTVTSSQTQLNEGNLFMDNIAIVVSAVCLLGLILFVVYDRHHNYGYLIAIRAKIGELKMKFSNLKNRKKQKNLKILSDQPPQSCKGTVGLFESQKTFPDGETSSVQQTLPTPKNIEEVMRDQDMVEQSPKINMKEVFQNKESGKSKSKSKLRGRVQIKKQFNPVSTQGLETKAGEDHPDQNNIKE